MSFFNSITLRVGNIDTGGNTFTAPGHYLVRVIASFENGNSNPGIFLINQADYQINVPITEGMTVSEVQSLAIERVKETLTNQVPIIVL